MPRSARQAPGGYVYHALNRAVARLTLFEKEEDYLAFERVLFQALEKRPIRLLGYCVMPNHWHLVLWPKREGELSAFLRWLTHTHTMRWHTHHHTSGTGHLYQGRFKAFPIEADEHLHTVLRFVERNPLRANLVKKVQDWRWSSVWQRLHGQEPSILHPWPVPMPENWLDLVRQPQTEAELEALRHSIARGSPFGSEAWSKRTVRRLGLESTIRPRGRPRKDEK